MSPEQEIEEKEGTFCTCKEKEYPAHICPYASLMDDEDNICNCCLYCEDECRFTT